MVKKNAKIAKKWKTSGHDTQQSFPKAVAFGIILIVRNGNASDLIAPRRDPPRRGRQDRPSVANRHSRTATNLTRQHGLQDGTLLTFGCRLVMCMRGL